MALQSLKKMGVRVNLDIGIVMVTVIPMLSMLMLGVGDAWRSAAGGWVAAFGCVLSPLVGYGILLRYPLTIIRLRKCIADVVRGELPEKIDLIEQDADIVSLTASLNSILDTLKRKVMAESFGSACHHLGQPFTVVEICLEMMQRRGLVTELGALLDDAIASMARIRTVLHRMQAVDQYRTEIYMPPTGGRQPVDCRIVSLS